MIKYSSTSLFKNALSSIYYSVHKHNLELPVLEFNGTVKVHGANHSVVFNHDGYYCQSKNRILEKEDAYQFSPFVEKNMNVLNNIKKNADIIFEQFKNKATFSYDEKASLHILNSDKNPEGLSVTLYGEWTGNNVQSGVAVSELPNMFIIFKVRYSQKNLSSEYDYWFSSEEMEKLKKMSLNDQINRLQKTPVDIHHIDHKVFFIQEFPQYHFKLDMRDPSQSQEFLSQLTQKVEDDCPVGKTFGVKGIGEGIVWSCVSEIEKINTKNLIFKTKGKRHSVVKEKKVVTIDYETQESIKELVEVVVTENRLNQGLDYLKEMGIERNMQSVSDLITFMIQDCFKEEEERFIDSGFDLKLIKKEIAQQSKIWYIDFIKNSEEKNKTHVIKIR